MILTVVHDKLANTFSFPQTTFNEATAQRDFALMQKTPGFPVGDCELCKVADFDNLSGKVIADFAVIVPAPEPVKEV